jgi:hypothetical protein
LLPPYRLHPEFHPIPTASGNPRGFRLRPGPGVSWIPAGVPRGRRSGYRFIVMASWVDRGDDRNLDTVRTAQSPVEGP